MQSTREHRADHRLDRPDGGSPEFAAVGPRLSRTPARSEWAGHGLGADTRNVLRQRLGLADDEIDAMVDAGVVAAASGCGRSGDSRSS